MTDMGIGLQEVGLALASRVISHDTLLSVQSCRMEDQVVAVGRTEYRHIALIALKLRPHSLSAFRVKLGTSSISHDPLSLHAAISDVNLVDVPCAVSDLTLSFYLHPIGHQSDAPRLARANSRLFSSTTSVLGRIGSLSSSSTHSTFDRRQRVDHILFSSLSLALLPGLEYERLLLR